MRTAAIFAFLDPDHLAMFGPWAIAVVCAVVFAETGLLVGFVFPGDTLLVVTGLLTQNDKLHLPIWLAAPAIAIAEAAAKAARAARIFRSLVAQPVAQLVGVLLLLAEDLL